MPPFSEFSKPHKRKVSHSPKKKDIKPEDYLIKNTDLKADNFTWDTEPLQYSVTGSSSKMWKKKVQKQMASAWKMFGPEEANTEAAHANPCVPLLLQLAASLQRRLRRRIAGEPTLRIDCEKRNQLASVRHGVTGKIEIVIRVTIKLKKDKTLDWVFSVLELKRTKGFGLSQFQMIAELAGANDFNRRQVKGLGLATDSLPPVFGASTTVLQSYFAEMTHAEEKCEVSSRWTHDSSAIGRGLFCRFRDALRKSVDALAKALLKKKLVKTA